MSASKGFFRSARTSDEVASFDDGPAPVTLLRYKPVVMSNASFQDSPDSGSGRSTPVTSLSPNQVKKPMSTFGDSPSRPMNTFHSLPATTSENVIPSSMGDFYLAERHSEIATLQPTVTAEPAKNPQMSSFGTLERTKKPPGPPPPPPTRADYAKPVSEPPTSAVDSAQTAAEPAKMVVDKENTAERSELQIRVVDNPVRPPRARDSVRKASLPESPTSTSESPKLVPVSPPKVIEIEIETAKTAVGVSDEIVMQKHATAIMAAEPTITTGSAQTKAEGEVQPLKTNGVPYTADQLQHTWPVQTHRKPGAVSSFTGKGLANGRPLSSCIYSSADNVSLNDDYEIQDTYSVMEKETNDLQNGNMKSSSLPDLITESTSTTQEHEHDHDHLPHESAIDSSYDSSVGDEAIKDNSFEGGSGSVRRPIATSTYSLPERNFSSLLRQRTESPPEKANTLSLKRGKADSKKYKKSHSYYEVPNSFSKHSASHDDSIIVIFDAYGRHDTVEVFATEGYCLKDVLFGPLNLRELNLNDVSVFLRNSKTPLPLHLDCYPLGGQELYIREKMIAPQELSNVTINRDKRKSYDPGAKNKDVPDGSMHRASVASFNFAALDLSKAAATGQKKEKVAAPLLTGKMLELYTQLQRYSTQGLPPIPLLLSMGMPQFDETALTLDSHWTQFVDGAEKFTKRMRGQQDALWELFETEVKYIRNVKVIIDLFWCCLLDLQNLQILNEIETEKVCLNIAEVYAANYEWWQSFLLPVLSYARETRSSLNVPLVTEAFQQFEELFLPYSRYCVEQAMCVNYIRQQQRDNELFAAFLTWAQEQSQCCRLKLADFVIMPMQRLTKYQLLLREVLKNTEHEQLKTSLSDVTVRVEGFVTKINTAVYHSEQMILLKGTIDRIDAYDVVEIPSEDCAKIISDLSKFDLAAPMLGCSPYQHRYLLQEGRLKLKDANAKLDVYCFLFTDMLLITKVLHRRADKVKVIKPPIRLDQVVIQQLADNSVCIVVLNDYRLATACYVLSSMSGVGASWLQPLLAAQTQYRMLRQKAFEASGEVALMQYLEEDYEDNVAVLNRMDRTDLHQSQSSLQSSISRLSIGGMSDSSSVSSEPSSTLGRRHFHTHSSGSRIDFIAEENEDDSESPRSSTKRANSMPSVGSDLQDLKAAAANVVSRQSVAVAAGNTASGDDSESSSRTQATSSESEIKRSDSQRSDVERTHGSSEKNSSSSGVSDNNNRKSVLDKYVYDDDDEGTDENSNSTSAAPNVPDKIVNVNNLHVHVIDDSQREMTIDPSEYQMWTPPVDAPVYRYEPTPNAGGVVEELVDMTAVNVGGASGSDEQQMTEPTVTLRHVEEEESSAASDSLPELPQQQQYRRSKTGAPYPPVKRKPTREEVAFIRKQILLNLKLDATEV